MLKIGDVYGMWKILSLGEKKNGKQYYNCKCECGTKRSVRGIGDKLSSMGCGCVKQELKKEYGNWKVIGKPKKEGYTYRVMVKCKCGNKNYIDIRTLRNGTSTSCGCKINIGLQSKKSCKKKGSYTGLSSVNVKQIRKKKSIGVVKASRFYNRYQSSRQRCNNKKNKNYKSYGLRGIKNNRNTFKDFVVDEYLNYCKALVKYYKFEKTNYKNIHMDRINNDGNYEKGNIRFISANENHKNTRYQDPNYISVQLHKDYKKLIPYLIRKNIVLDKIIEEINGLQD